MLISREDDRPSLSKPLQCVLAIASMCALLAFLLVCKNIFSVDGLATKAEQVPYYVLTRVSGGCVCISEVCTKWAFVFGLVVGS